MIHCFLIVFLLFFLQRYYKAIDWPTFPFQLETKISNHQKSRKQIEKKLQKQKKSCEKWNHHRINNTLHVELSLQNRKKSSCYLEETFATFDQYFFKQFPDRSSTHCSFTNRLVEFLLSFNRRLSQLVERSPTDHKVVGFIPTIIDHSTKYVAKIGYTNLRGKFTGS